MLRSKSHLILALAAIGGGTVGVLVKLIGSEIPIMTLVFYRVLIAFLFLLAVVPFLDKNAFKVSRKDLAGYFLVGVIYAVNLSLFVAANFFAPVQNVVLINSSYPFFVFVFAYFILRERITFTKIITLITALIAMSIINPFSLQGNELGNILAMLSAVFHALLLTGLRKENKSHGIGDVLWFFFFATLLLSPFPFIYGFGNVQAVLPFILVLGLVGTGLTYLFLNLALEKMEAEMASITSIIIGPLVAVALAVLIINESLNEKILTGGALLILAGIYLETHSKTLKFRGTHKRNSKLKKSGRGKKK